MPPSLLALFMHSMVVPLARQRPATQTSPAPHSLLSLPYERLAALGGGVPAARLVWRQLNRGDDPAASWSAASPGGGNPLLEEATSFGLTAQRRAALLLSLGSPSLSSVASIVAETCASDGTRKLLLRLHDGLEVETVGCRQACSFCATGRMGLLRNLTSSEILAQAWHARAAAARAGMPPLNNLVFMGMGEPADNLVAVRAALASLVDPRRFGFAREKVVVSTVAPSPSVFASILEAGEAAADADAAPALAWSLHAADDALRRRLVPTARFSVAELRDGLCEALRARPSPRRRKVLIEYVLIAGVNDGVADAERVADLLRPVEAACYDPARRSKRTGVLVNLIPYNPTYDPEAHQGTAGDGARGRKLPMAASFERPSWEAIDAFQAKLRELGIWTSVRAARGDDEAAACGQLATEHARRRGRRERRGSGASEADVTSTADVTSAADVPSTADETPAADALRGVGCPEELLLPSSPLLDDERHTCCLTCQGTGRLPRRRRRSVAKARRAGASASPPPTEQCGECAGVGLVPATVTEASVPTVDGGSASGIEAVGVAIVGGGIGGLALALALQQRGMRCAVFEKDGRFDDRAQGYALTLQAGASAVHALGLTEAVGRLGSSSSVHYSIDAENGQVIGVHGARSEAARVGTHSRESHTVGASESSSLESRLGSRLRSGRVAAHRRNLHLPRQSLRALLLSRLQPGTVRWGHSLERVDTTAGGVELGFAGGERAAAEVLVGADGIRSATRAALYAGNVLDDDDGSSASHVTDGPLRPLDVMVVLGFASVESPLTSHSDTVFEVVDGDARVYAQPFAPPPHASTMWQLSYPMDPEQAALLAREGGAALRAEALRICGQWPEPLPSLLHATSPEHVTGYPVFDREVGAGPLFSPTEGGPPASHAARAATLVGDAAHPMAPFKGQGANQALLDTIHLARALYDSAAGDEAAAAAMGHGDDGASGARRRRRRSGSPVQVALRAFEAENAGRALAKVEASREATRLLHSPAARAVAATAVTRARAAAAATGR